MGLKCCLVLQVVMFVSLKWNFKIPFCYYYGRLVNVQFVDGLMVMGDDFLPRWSCYSGFLSCFRSRDISLEMAS